MMSITLTVDGKKYRGTYNHSAGGLPELRIAGLSLRGSSLGPANYLCRPDAADRDYWRSIVRGDIEDRSKVTP